MAVDCAGELLATISWSGDPGRINIPAVCVEEWLAGPAAVWGECDEATTVALLVGMGSELAGTPMAVATGSEDGEEARLREEGKAPSPSPGMPALAAIAKLAVTNICKTRIAKNVIECRLRERKLARLS